MTADHPHKETITVRKGLDFGFKQDTIPKYWMENDPFKTRLMDIVQAVFPDGERYFMSSVNAFKNDVKDSELHAEVLDFMQQEGQHGRVHTEYNQRLARQGLKVHAFENEAKKIANRRLKWLSPAYNVALTAALEHITAMMADLFFAEKKVMAGADKRVRAMLAWHAIEEMEHKAVAFDVMQQVAKVGYFRRVLAMFHAATMFSIYILFATWAALRMDGFTRRQVAKMYLKATGWMLSLSWRLTWMIGQYYLPGFHPNKVKTVHNYQAWLAGYATNHDPIEAADAMVLAAR